MTLYTKVGRRYRPVQDTLAYDGLTNGAWIVTIENGLRSAHKIVDTSPTHAEMAACADLTKILVEELQEWSQSRPARPLTAKEKKAWQAYCDVMGPDATLTLERPSAWDVAEKVARRVVERAKGTKRKEIARETHH